MVCSGLHILGFPSGLGTGWYGNIFIRLESQESDRLEGGASSKIRSDMLIAVGGRTEVSGTPLLLLLETQYLQIIKKTV